MNHSTFFCLVLALVSQVPPTGVSESARQAPTKDDESAQRLAEMTQIAQGFKFAVVDGVNRTPAKLLPDPSHRWTDPTRPFSGGALWVCKSEDRPVAVLGIELYAAWSLEFVSLSTGLVEAQDDSLRWRPQKAGVKYSEIAGAPAPAGDEAQRMRQMKDILRRIGAREFYDNKHYALRLLAHPIDRYADPASGVIDGAIFIYANGTNPEILLLLEARRNDKGTPTWTYAAAPLSRRSQPETRWQGCLDESNQGRPHSPGSLLRHPEGSRVSPPARPSPARKAMIRSGALVSRLMEIQFHSAAACFVLGPAASAASMRPSRSLSSRSKSARGPRNSRREMSPSPLRSILRNHDGPSGTHAVRQVKTSSWRQQTDDMPTPVIWPRPIDIS